MCKSGDSRGFQYLITAYASRLMGICIRYMKDEQRAKDVLQESYISIFKGISSFISVGSLERWMVKITVNHALMTLRKEKNYLTKVVTDDHFNELFHESDLEVKLNEEDILHMLWELPDHYRIIFNLFVVEGYNHQEIGKMLQISESLSRTRLTRARGLLKEIYLKNEEKKIEITSTSQRKMKK